jgi:hypothetical protein
MAHFAEVDENNIVLRVLVVDDLHESNGQDYLANTLGLGGTWLKTSYNTNAGRHAFGGTPFRKNYAGTGSVYDAERDAFIAPKPYASWVLNEESCIWEAPVAKPENENRYEWNEETTSWDLVPNESAPSEEAPE